MQTWRTEVFVELGKRIRKEGVPVPVRQESLLENSWFTDPWIEKAATAVAGTMLMEESLAQWLGKYEFPRNFSPKNIGLVMAGNIPLVGWADLMAVLVCGHTPYVKCSSKDRVLMTWMMDTVKEIDPAVSIHPLEEGSVIDAVIATGSNIANRYFESRFKGVPSLFRRNRTSVAVLSGEESDEQLMSLWDDIFLYFGLGCRSVTRVFIPQHFDLGRIISLYAEKENETLHKNFGDCYRYNKALHRLESEPFTDARYFTLAAATAAGMPPVAEIAYHRYQKPEDAGTWIAVNDAEIQCVSTAFMDHPRAVPLGQSQYPRLWDYPDGEDTMAFLLSV